MRRSRTAHSGRTVSRAAALLIAIPVIGVASATGASADVNTVGGGAFGESVAVTTPAGSVNSGPIPTVTLPSTGGGPFTSNVASASAPPLLTAGVMTVRTEGATGATGFAASEAHVAELQLGPSTGPFLAADAVRSDCRTDKTGSYGGTTLVGANLNGNPVDANPPPNTTVPIPGVGSVIFNEQIIDQEPGSSSITVNAIHVKLDGSLGTGDIIVSQSRCSGEGPNIVIPTGAIGGLLLTGLVALVFVGYQLRRRFAGPTTTE